MAFTPRTEKHLTNLSLTSVARGAVSELKRKDMSTTDLSTAHQPARRNALTPFDVEESYRRWSLSTTAETDTRWEVDSLDEDQDPEDDSFAESPATDVFSDESPAVTCSELGSERFRLVKIRPGLPGSTIECEVSTCFLDQAPSYTAVSYTWGSPLAFREILIEDRPHKVPKNLWRFLHHARKVPHLSCLAGWLWIDTLSIHQSDPREKLEQVGIISSIFKNAERVIVWLGPSYGDSDRAFAALCSISTKRSQRDSKSLAEPVWSSVRGLCERPYWRRLWVYQEIKSASCAEFMCGPTLVPLQKFQGYLFDAVSSRLKDKFEILRKSPAGKMLCLVQDPAKTSLLSLMQNTCHLRCVDPRDKAYAVLNIAKIEKQVIEADYTITVTILLTRTLKSIHDSSMPTSLHRVAKQCMELERLFEEPPNSIFETESREAFSRDINPLRELAATLRPDFNNDWARGVTFIRMQVSTGSCFLQLLRGEMVPKTIDTCSEPQSCAHWTKSTTTTSRLYLCSLVRGIGGLE
jgi:hypothetical protein